MNDDKGKQRIFNLLGLVCALGIFYRSVGANMLEGICRLAGHTDVFTFSSGTVTTQLVTLAGILIGGSEFNRYICSKNKGSD
jgi:hypothetical protein